MGFADLPTEIHLQIFSHVDRPSLKATRQVCRIFRDNASPSLFERALACTRYTALSTLQKISRHPIYAGYVKEIVFDGSMYNPLLAKSEQQYHRHANRIPELESGFSWEKHTRFKRYQELYDDQEAIREGGILFAEFARALEWMPKVSTLTYSPGPREVPLEAKIMKNILPRQFDREFTIGNSFGVEVDRLPTGFQELIGAIYQAQYTGIREFRVEHGPRISGTPFELTEFDLPTDTHVEVGKFFFSHLHAIHIGLLFPDRPVYHYSSYQRREIETLAIMLREANNLKHLHLCDSSREDVRLATLGVHILPTIMNSGSGLGGCPWPNLQYLNLESFGCHEGWLIDLIDKMKDSLKELHLKDFKLGGLGKWANVVDKVLQDTKILPFTLTDVFVGGQNGGLPPGYPESWTKYSGEAAVNGEGYRCFIEPDGAVSLYDETIDLEDID